nr:hypothetical protein [Tanacetum cinerariifolium]
MPPKRTSAAARAANVVAVAATTMTAAAVEQLIKARVSAALANYETLLNNPNDQGDGSHNSVIGMRGTVRTPCECAYKDFLNCKPLTFKGCYSRCCLCYGLEDTKKDDDRKILPKGMFHEESEEVKKYVGGLHYMIQGNVMSYQPKTMAKAIEFDNDQMDQKDLTISERQAEQKRKIEFVTPPNWVAAEY